MFSRLTFIAVLFASTLAQAQEVTMPLSEWQSLRERERVLRAKAEASGETEVVVGVTRYRGRIDSAGLHLTMVMRVELGANDRYKEVAVIGNRVVVVAARLAATPVALIDNGEFWTWVTRQRGVAELTVDLVVPASGPRGSAEYLFEVVESPVTDLTCTFADRDLSPRVDGAVSNVVRQTPNGGELTAIIGPTTSIHLVGFRELAQAPTAAAKLYADTQSLMSLADESVELFTVVNLTILYAPQKRFRIALPAGYELVSADGEGAFQYTVETVDGARIITGETSYGIRQSYEISLRLKRPLAAGESSVPLAIPRMLDVERDSGFVAIEVPGKLAITAVTPEGAARFTPLDVRELPATLIDSSVTPIVRAFQYSDAASRAAIAIARYPTKPVEGDSIDALVVHTVTTEDGSRLTELSVKLRNAHRQYLPIGVPTAATVRSATVEGDPVKPSRDAQGKLLLPLVRSRQEGEGLRPINVQLVYQEQAGIFGIFGRAHLDLPAIELPIASLQWTVDVPQRYAVSRLRGPVAQQSYAGTAQWQSPRGEDVYRDDDESMGLDQLENTLEQGFQAQGLRRGHALGGMRGAGAARQMPIQAQTLGAIGDGNSGGVAVRVQVPHAGHEMGYRRYWIDAQDPVWVELTYLRRAWLRGLEMLALLALVIGAVVVVWRAEARRRAVMRWTRDVTKTQGLRLAEGARFWTGAFADRFANRRKTSPAWAYLAASIELTIVGGIALTVTLLSIALMVAAARLLWLAGHPL